MKFAEVQQGQFRGDWGEVVGESGPVVHLEVKLSPVASHRGRVIIVPRTDLRPEGQG